MSNITKIKEYKNNKPLFKKDPIFKKNGLRKYSFKPTSFAKEIANFATPSLKDKEVENEVLKISDDSVEFPSRFEADLKLLHKEHVNSLGLTVKSLLSQLDRTIANFEQRSPEWFEKRDLCYTSTTSLLTSTGISNANKYRTWAFNIARQIGGEAGERIESSLLTLAEADKRGLHWVDPKDRGTEAEPRVRKLITEVFKLKRPIIEVGMNMLSGTIHTDSDDGSFIAPMDFDFKEGKNGFDFLHVVNPFSIKKFDRVLVEIKSPSFANYLDPKYTTQSSLWIQAQQHLIVGGADKVLSAKYFEGFPLKLEVIELDEAFAERFLEELAKEEEERIRIEEQMVSYYFENHLEF